MTLSDDLPPQLTKDVKRRNRKRRSVKSKDVEVLLSVATRVARIAKDKGYYTVSPEAIRCVEVLRMMRSLPLTPRLITRTNALRSLQFLATNGVAVKTEIRLLPFHPDDNLQLLENGMVLLNGRGRRCFLTSVESHSMVADYLFDDDALKLHKGKLIDHLSSVLQRLELHQRQLKAELSSVLCHDEASTKGVSFTSLLELSSAGPCLMFVARRVLTRA
uniref:Uncharacterized protein n=1 Tax=Brassica oleracea var. oleracea TaxID=109376 RepID=A0A0D3A9P6_BRAOL